MPRVRTDFFAFPNDSYRNWIREKVPALKQKTSVSSRSLEGAAFSTFAIASPFKFLDTRKFFSQTAPGTSGALSFALKEMKNAPKAIKLTDTLGDVLFKSPTEGGLIINAKKAFLDGYSLEVIKNAWHDFGIPEKNIQIFLDKLIRSLGF